MDDPVSGGFVRVAPGIDHRHVLMKDGQWELLERVHRDWIREFNGGMGMMLGSGQIVPMLDTDEQQAGTKAEE